MLYFRIILISMPLLMYLPISKINAQISIPENYGAQRALKDTSIEINEALIYAVQDEYLAQARYSRIINEYGQIRPFANILNAEKMHVQVLLPLFQKYKVPIPQNTASKYGDIPLTIKKAYYEGIKGEKANISMYNKFLSLPNIPKDIKTAFHTLKNASQKHLNVFKAEINK